MIGALRTAYQRHRTLVVYCAIGGTGATLDLVVFLVLTRAGLDATVATVISVSCGIVNNFVLNVLVNYRVRDRILLRFLSFYAVGLVGVAMSAGVLFVMSDVMGAPVVLSKIVSIPLIVVAQFGLNNFVTFARANRPAALPMTGVVDV